MNRKTILSTEDLCLKRSSGTFMMKKLSHINQLIADKLVVIACLVAVSTFVLAQPRISAIIIPGLREYRIQNYTESIQKQQTIDPWQYWQFRDLLQMGSLSLASRHPDVLRSTEIHTLVSRVHSANSFKPWIVYQSKKTNAVEGLVATSPGVALSEYISIPEGEVLLSSATDLVIFSQGTNAYSIVFLRPVATMATVNGYLNFAEREEAFKAEAANNQWLTISEIRL